MAYLKDIIEKPITGEWGTDGNEVKVLRTTNFTNSGILDFSSVVKRNITEIKVEQKKLIKGDIIIEKSGGSPTQPVGRVVYFNEEGVYLCNNFTSILRPKKAKVEPKYLHYLLYSSHRFGVTGMFQNKTTGIINLQLPRYVNKLEIPLPPLKVQKVIAQILDHSASLRDKTKEQLKEYDLLAQSIFFEMFGDIINNQKGWKKVKFQKIFSSIRYGASSPPIYQKNGVPFIRATNVKKGQIVEKGLVYISVEESKKIAKCSLKEGNLIIVRSGANTGDCSRIPKKYANAFGGFDIIIDIEEPQSTFCNFLLNTKAAKAILQPLTRRAGQPHINSKQLSELELFSPPIDLQYKFAKIIALIEDQKVLAKEELNESKDLFNCLLQKAFKGELK